MRNKLLFCFAAPLLFAVLVTVVDAPIWFLAAVIGAFIGTLVAIGEAR